MQLFRRKHTHIHTHTYKKNNNNSKRTLQKIGQGVPTLRYKFHYIEQAPSSTMKLCVHIYIDIIKERFIDDLSNYATYLKIEKFKNLNLSMNYFYMLRIPRIISS